MNIHEVYNITKEYPDMFKVVSFKQPVICVKNDDVVKRPKELVGDDYVPCYSSLTRTKALVKDLVLCNEFDYFMTFTFNPDKVDRFNYNKCLSVMRKWLHRQHDRDHSFLYLVIPEQHKSGAWHFHGLISHYNGPLRDSGIRTVSLRPIYNVTGFRSGFTTAVRIDSKEAVANYVTKYITKDLIKEFNQRRFLASKGLRRPVKQINSDVLRRTLPLFRRLVSSSRSVEVFEIDNISL